MTRIDVAVVGGGVAGITAALDCADGGASVTLLEVRPRLGGAAYSFERDGLMLDNGQHVFLRCCTAYRGLLERLGSEPLTMLQPRLRIPVLAPGRATVLLARGRLPAPLHLARTLIGYHHLTRRERILAGYAALALRRLDPATAARDEQTLGDWLANHHQSPRALANLWDLIALPTLNLPAAEASLALGSFVFKKGLLEDPGAGDVGIHRAPLSEIIDEPARFALAGAGVDVRLRHRVRRIVEESDGAFLLHADGEPPLRAERVILSVPHARAAELLPQAALAYARWPTELRSSPIVNLHVSYDRPVFEEPFAAAVESPVQYLFDRTQSTDGQYIGVSLSGAEQAMRLDRAALRERFVPAIEQLLPRAAGAMITRFLVTREYAATFRAEPGVERLRPGAATGVPGLALAGAWTATGWPATLESAALSGHAAARVVMGSVSAPLSAR